MSYIHSNESDVPFNKQFLIVDFTQKEIDNLSDRLRKLKSKLRTETKKLQSMCDHTYVRECLNDSCYREYAYICSKCKHFK